MTSYREKKILITTIIILLQLVTQLCQSKRVSYSGYAVYRSFPQTQQQINKLTELMNERRENGIEFWTEPRMLNSTVDIMVSPEEEPFLREQLRMMKVPTKKIMYDVENVIRKTSVLPVLSLTQRQLRQMKLLESNSSAEITKALKETLDANFFYTRYSRYSMIEAKLRDLAKDQRVTMEVIGKSSEGRDLYLVKVSSNPSAKKPVIFLDAGHHAREWISHATLIYILESLVNENMPKKYLKKTPKYLQNNEISDDAIVMSEVNQKNSSIIDNKQKRIVQSISETLQEFDFWFIPVVNPDGYEYSHVSDRNWRKTRSRSGVYCTGVDPNRNYPHHWSESGVSSFSCSDIYPGSKALSEPEVAAVAETLAKNKDLIKMYVSLHAYSQMLLTPYGYKPVYPDNYNDLSKVGLAGRRAIYSVRGTEYKVGPSAVLLYPAAGGSDDYAHGNCDIKFSYTMELPDVGNYGFLLPPEEIIPVGEETTVGLTAMIDTMRSITNSNVSKFSS